MSPQGALTSGPVVYLARGAPFLGCGFGRARNCDVSQLTIPANELCEPPGPGDGVGYSSFSACSRSHSMLPGGYPGLGGSGGGFLHATAPCRMYSKCPSLGTRSTRRSVSAQTSASTRSGENPAALRSKSVVNAHC